MKAPALTSEEQAHIEKGGRVFIVEEISGPLWRVLCVSASGCRVMLKPDGAEGYSSRQYPQDLALSFANLSEDSPLVRHRPYGYKTTPQQTELGVAWHLRFFENGKAVGDEIFPVTEDSEEAYWTAQAEADKAGEAWLSLRW